MSTRRKFFAGLGTLAIALVTVLTGKSFAPTQQKFLHFVETEDWRFYYNESLSKGESFLKNEPNPKAVKWPICIPPDKNYKVSAEQTQNMLI